MSSQDNSNFAKSLTFLTIQSYQGDMRRYSSSNQLISLWFLSFDLERGRTEKSAGSRRSMKRFNEDIHTSKESIPFLLLSLSITLKCTQIVNCIKLKTAVDKLEELAAPPSSKIEVLVSTSITLDLMSLTTFLDVFNVTWY